MKTRLKLILLCHLLSAICLSLNAQTYSINWSKIAGGGGSRTNGPYSISSTIAQHDASQQTSGGNYTLTGGFWSLVSAVQSAGAPALTIKLLNPTTVRVSWPYPSTGWTLQQSPDLTRAIWSVSSGINHDATNNFIILTAPKGNLFFRLKQ